MAEVRKRTERIRQPSDLWDLEQFLSESHSQVDRQFDYRYSVLIFVFGDLVRRGRLSEQELQGLSEDKLTAIRKYAEPLDLIR